MVKTGFLLSIATFALVGSLPAVHAQEPLTGQTCWDYHQQKRVDCDFNGLEKINLGNGFTIYAPSIFEPPELDKPYKKTWRQVDFASWTFFEGWKAAGPQGKVRHPFILIADEDPQNPSGALGVELTQVKKSKSGTRAIPPGHYLAVEESNKPRTLDGHELAKSKKFTREFACYSNVDLSHSTFLDIYRGFNSIGKRYHVGGHNCQHFFRYAMERICGPDVLNKLHQHDPILQFLGNFDVHQCADCIRGPHQWKILYSPHRTAEEIKNPTTAKDRRQFISYDEGDRLANKRSSPNEPVAFEQVQVFGM